MVAVSTAAGVMMLWSTFQQRKEWITIRTRPVVERNNKEVRVLPMQKRSDLPLRNRYKKRIVERDWRFMPKAHISRREFSFVSPKLFAPKRVTEASPEYETDRKDESKIAVGSGSRRRRQWRGTCEQ